MIRWFRDDLPLGFQLILVYSILIGMFILSDRLVAALTCVR